MKIIDFPQGSEEWAQARCGRATASEFSSVLAKGQGKMRTAYLRRLVAERLTGKPTEGYKNAHMERGQEQEQFARAAYEIKTNSIVDKVGFIQHESLMLGCSPDGFVGIDGGVEIKSVIPTVQLETILTGGYPSEHRAQIQGNLWLSGRAWWDFCSFSEDLPENLRTYVFRVLPDAKYIVQLEAEVTVFLREVDALLDQLKGMQ